MCYPQWTFCLFLAADMPDTKYLKCIKLSLTNIPCRKVYNIPILQVEPRPLEIKLFDQVDVSSKWWKTVLVSQSCPILCDCMDYSPPGCSVPGILQTRILEWVAIPFSKESSWPRDQTRVSDGERGKMQTSSCRPHILNCSAMLIPFDNTWIV